MKKARLQFCMLLLVWAVTLCQAQSTEDPNNAATEAQAEEIKLELNFMNAPLQTIVEYLSEKAGLVILSNNGLDQRMTVISRTPVGVDEAIDLINTVLKENGYTAFRRGRTLRVTTLSNSIIEAGMKVDEETDPQKMLDDDTMQFQIVPIRYRDAAQLSENLQPLIPEYASLQANEEGNVLLISDTRANIKRLLEIVKAMDKPLTSVAKMQVFRLRYAEADSVATLINNMFKEQASSSNNRNNRNNNRGGRGGRGGPQAMFEMFANRGNNNSTDPSRGSVPVNAAGDERTNSVVVSASEDQLVLIAELIKQVDTVTPELADIRVYHLKNADAETVADMVNEMFSSDSSSRSNQQQNRRFGGRGGPGGFMAMMQQNNSSGASSNAQVLASADERTNSVVVSGPPESFTVIEQLITTLDTTQANIADVKVFHLEHADADNVAELINDVFSSTSTSRRSSSNQQNNRQFRGRGGFGQQTTEASGSTAEVVASSDSRTNSVVVSGPPETLLVIEGVIKELDANPEQERQIFTYALKNANAANIMEILNDLFQEIQALNQQNTGRNNQTFQGGRGGGGTTTSSSGSSDNGGLDEETYFQADEESNTLLIMTSAKNYKLVKPIIDDLDKPVGQVLIKVLFAEVTHSDKIDLGTEFSKLNLLDTTHADWTGSTSFGNLTSGMTFSSSATDLDLRIQALQETGRLNVLSRPYILTSNNQTATITVGEEVPIPEGTNVTDGGNTQTNVTYRDDIGIVLEVTPSINPNGLVNMTVVPKITTRNAQTVQVSEDLEALAFSTRSANTKVAVRNGHTIVIGGLIEDKLTDTIKKVPLLGDIPLAGALFRRTTKEKTKTELLIFLTPLVAEDANDLLPISEMERSRSNLKNDPSSSEIFKTHMDGMEAKPKMKE